MTARQFLFLGTSVLASCLFWACRRASTESIQDRVVRLAELEIDPAQLDNTKRH